MPWLLTLLRLLFAAGSLLFLIVLFQAVRRNRHL